MKSALALVFLLSLTFCSSNQPNLESSPVSSQENFQELPKIQLGFNVKGLLGTTQQLNYLDRFLSGLPQNLKENLHLRVSGGTSSQREMPTDWSDADINAWADMSKKHGFHLVFVVNGNDTPQSQRALAERWVKAGINFSFIEMMNEYYLVKFRDGDVSKDEVTRSITPEIYANEILPNYIGAFKSMNIPLFIIFAPEKPKKAGELMAEWNRVVLKAMDNFKDVELGATIHLYKRPGQEFNYNQVNKLREMLPKGTAIAVTEAGTLELELSSEQEGQVAFDHYMKIAQTLKPGDYLFDHILYTNYKKKDNFATLHPNYNGLSPKGEQVVKFMKLVYPE